MGVPVIGRATEAARHPVSTLASVIGVTRGLAASVLRIAAGKQPDEVPPGPVEPTSPERVVPQVSGAPAAPQRPPAPPGESFATEPSAVNRDSAHARGGADEQIDDWYGEAEDELPDGVVETLAAHDPPDH